LPASPPVTNSRSRATSGFRSGWNREGRRRAGEDVMRIVRSFPLVAVISAALLACGGTSSVDEPAAAASEARVKPSPWTFTKIPSAWAAHTVASPALGLDAMAFEMTASGAKGDVVTSMAFMITGTVQAGDLASFQLFYFPGGLDKAGSLVGSNDGSTFAPGPTTSIVPIDLTAPITVGQKFKGDFVLRVDVIGTGSFFFSPQLQTVTVDVAGVPTFLVGATCALPLPGDTFNVN
jgi:hypothetical protein